MKCITFGQLLIACIILSIFGAMFAQTTLVGYINTGLVMWWLTGLVVACDPQ